MRVFVQSSAASGGLFSNLQQHKRGSEDYADRRASHSEQMASSGGAVAGWFNKTFRGVGGSPATIAEGDKSDQKRGVME